MIKAVVIDGNNLAHKAAPFKNALNKDAYDVRYSLAEAVKSRIANKIKILFFFDGYGDEKDGIKFSGSVSADEKIIKFIQAYKKPSELKIVSSDNDVTGIARAYGCTVQDSGAFWDEINPEKGITPDKNINQLFIYDDEKPSGLSKKDLKEFRKYFT